MSATAAMSTALRMDAPRPDAHTYVPQELWTVIFRLATSVNIDEVEPTFDPASSIELEWAQAVQEQAKIKTGYRLVCRSWR